MLEKHQWQREQIIVNLTYCKHKVRKAFEQLSGMHCSEKDKVDCYLTKAWGSYWCRINFTPWFERIKRGGKEPGDYLIRLMSHWRQVYIRVLSVVSYLILSYLILSYLILSYLILSYLILSYLILSYLILSYLILSYLILSYLILPYPILSYLVGSCILLSFVSTLLSLYS